MSGRKPAFQRAKSTLVSFAQSPPFHTKMEAEIEVFRDNVDSWIKQIRREFSDFSELPSLVNENVENIQHNYELIYELKDQIEELKQEVSALKLIQIISLKQKTNKVEQQEQA
ncbi:MAG TPA: hypothetical protein VJI52_03015 [Candidatus Nanoarchaeia archaeon]|nr:hypothetical protein [Candidatus Nanoarchaeia archaeon]